MMGRLGAWWRKRRERRATLADLAACSAAERGRLARDAGVAAGELQVLAGKWPDAADLLAPRLAMLGLDAAALGRTAPSVMRDLQRVCSVCSNQRVCAHDLARGGYADDVPGYCANATTLDALRARRTETGGRRR
jgi:hypothetical protein